MLRIMSKLTQLVGKTATADDESAERPFDSLPDEMVVHVLSWAEADALLSCRLVCKRWQLLVDARAFQEKASRENRRAGGLRSFSAIDADTVNKLDLPWYVFHAICKYDPFNRNLVKNHCGQKKFDHWSVNNDIKWWSIEKKPVGASELPDDPDFDGHTSCFVSSFRVCSKKQTVNLKKYGLNETIMKILQPEIAVSEWHSGRFDSGYKYEFQVTLFDKHRELLNQEGVINNLPQWEANKWTKVSFSYSNSSNASHVIVYHSGVDTQYWAGFYGAKISGTVVKVLLPIKLKKA